MKMSEELKSAKKTSDDLYAAYLLIRDVAREEDDNYIHTLASRVYNVYNIFRRRYLEIMAAEIDGGNA